RVSRTLPRPTAFTSLATLASAILLALAVPASAQDAVPDDAGHEHGVTDLDTLRVRANPIARTAADLARPVAVLAGERLDDAKAQSGGQTGARLRGVRSSFVGAGVGRPRSRGLEGARAQVLSAGLSAGGVSTVSVDHAVSSEPFLANRIELLKGPA